MTIKSHYTGYVVYWSCINILFKYCLSCGCLYLGINVNCRVQFCYKGYKNIWRAQQVINRHALGDLRLVASTLYSANTYAKLEAFFKLANIPFLCKTWYNIQKKFLVGVIDEAWLNERTISISGIKKKPACSLSGNGHCDSPGHCAKYMTYSIFSHSNSRRHLPNADVIADVKSKIIVSRRHFFADVIFSATSKVQNYPNLYTQTNTCSLHISRNFKDIFKYICFTLYL